MLAAPPCSLMLSLSHTSSPSDRKRLGENPDGSGSCRYLSHRGVGALAANLSALYAATFYHSEAEASLIHEVG